MEWIVIIGWIVVNIVVNEVDCFLIDVNYMVVVNIIINGINGVDVIV